MPQRTANDVAKPTDLDLEAYWMPFTANRRFKALPKLLVRAQGMYYTSHDDRQILDATSGLWCVNAGHARTKIVEAIREQAATLDYAPGFQLGHPGEAMPAWYRSPSASRACLGALSV